MAANNHRLLIKNAHLYDPGSGIDRYGDLPLFKNRIVEELPDDGTNLMIIDADGALVLPGLIDFHVHVGYGSSEVAAPTDLTYLPNGVTTVVDAGTRGIANIDQMCRQVVPSVLATIKCLLHVSPTGIVSMKYEECIDPKYFDLEQIRFCFEKYPDILKGLKIRITKTSLPDYASTGLDPLKKALEIAGELGLFLSVHVTNPPGGYREIVELLRPGDVLVHPYQGVGATILQADGSIDPSVIEAQKRGVLMDLAAARTNQDYVIARAAIEQGFVPDIFSTDLARDSIYMQPVFSLPYVLSTYRNLGVPMEHLIKGCTSVPAAKLGMLGEIGTLRPGARADVCILREKKVEREFTDWFGHTIPGSVLYRPEATIKDGRLVYLDIEAKQNVIHRLELV